MGLTVNEYIIVQLLGIIMWTGAIYAINYSDIYFKWHHIIYVLIAIFSGFLITDFISGLLYNLFWGLFTLIFVFIIPSQFQKKKKDKVYQDRKYTAQIIVVNLYNIISSVSLHSLVEINNNLERFFVWLPFFVMLLIINYIILYAKKKSQELEKQDAVANQYVPLIDAMGEEIKMRQHDFDNHLNTLIGMMESRKHSKDTYEEVEKYLYAMEGEEYIGDLIKLHNRIVAGFLYSKRKYADEHGIELTLVLKDFEIKTKLKDFELIEILSVLVDNAFEADVENNKVSITFDKIDGKNVISVANKFRKITNQQMNDFFKKGYSTKGNEDRGIGLYKIQRLIMRKNGSIVVSNQQMDNDQCLVFEVTI
jgi:hypothetical protein